MLHPKFLSIVSQLHVALENTASPDFEGPSSVRIEPALQHFIPLLHQGCCTCSALRRLKDSWTLDCIFEVQVDLPPEPSRTRSSARYLCLTGTFYEAHEISEVVHAQFLEACSRINPKSNCLLPQSVACSAWPTDFLHSA